MILSKHRNLTFVYFASVAVCLMSILILSRASLYRQWWPLLILVPVILLGFYFRKSLTPVIRLGWVGFAVAIILVYGNAQIQTMRKNIANPPEWDFHLFWLFGRASAESLNPYDHENLLRLGASLNSSDALLDELYCFHAPPALFMYAPLGWFDIHAAYLVWHILNSLFLFGCIYLLWKIFLDTSGWQGILLVTALILMLPTTWQTIYLGQINFIVLLFMLLFWRDRDLSRGGIWLALGTLVKPIMVFLPLYSLIRQQQHVIVRMLITLAVCSLLTIIIYGPTMFFSYITQNPIVNSLPKTLYTEETNQSLMATVLRLTQYDVNAASPYLNPVFIILTIVVIGVTAWLIYRLQKLHGDWALALTILMAMLIFPKTLQHYSVLLILPLLFFFTHPQEFLGRIWGRTACVAVIYALIGYDGGSDIFVAISLVWLTLVIISIRMLIHEPVESAKMASA